MGIGGGYWLERRTSELRPLIPVRLLFGKERGLEIVMLFGFHVMKQTKFVETANWGLRVFGGGSGLDLHITEDFGLWGIFGF